MEKYEFLEIKEKDSFLRAALRDWAGGSISKVQICLHVRILIHGWQHPQLFAKEEEAVHLSGKRSPQSCFKSIKLNNKLLVGTAQPIAQMRSDNHKIGRI